MASLETKRQSGLALKTLLRSATSRARQAARMSRLGLNLLTGATLIESLHQFPKWSDIQQRQLSDYHPFRLWVADLNKSMNVQLHVYGEIMPEEGLFVSNHISWLDTIVMSKLKAVSFVARYDIAGWPWVGTFTKRMDSIYIDRSNKFKAYRSIPALEQRLVAKRSVHIFPEATTSVGSEVLPFFPMFYEAAVRTGRPVQPVVFRYTDADNRLLGEAAYIDDDSFVDTLKRILTVDRVHAHVYFLPPLDARSLSRKDLCRRSHQAIADCLKAGFPPVAQA